jgi:hypothetical protein
MNSTYLLLNSNNLTRLNAMAPSLNNRVSVRRSAPLLLILLPEWSPIWISEEQRTENTRFFAASPE